VVSSLTEGLVARGHDVILAASGDSRTRARLHAVYPRSLRTADGLGDRSPYEWIHIATALRQARDVDVVHNHAGELAMAMTALLPGVPVLTTMHCLPTPDTRFVWDRYEGAFNTISKSQARLIAMGPRSTFVGHVYNGIEIESFPFQADKDDYLLFLSRIAPEKGPQHAIRVARMTGRRLILAGKVDRADADFYQEVVRPLIDGDQIVFVGEANAERKRRLYRAASCLLMPLCWDEPFGLVMPEAMACGTPVIAFRRGSAPELIQHGETGFIVDTVEEMAAAVAGVERLDPRRCREHVAHNFSQQRMVEGYLDLYEMLAAAPPRNRRQVPVDQPAIRGDGRAAVA
jgi:glycosyltransferase involved in cell wall biosynthesis